MSGTILAVADSDSYLKYAVHLLEHLPHWKRQLMVVRSPVQPTSVQTRSALAGTFLQGRPPAVLPLRKLAANVSATPDVVLVAGTAHSAREVLLRFSESERRPGLVTALPGIGLPARRKAFVHRELADLHLVHSLTEAEAFSSLDLGKGESAIRPIPLALTRLPMLRHDAPVEPVDAPLKRLVFAVQAMMPFEQEERERILLCLAATARRHPGLEVVVKLRAHHGEPQTHRERLPYDTLWAGLVKDGRVTGSELVWEAGPLLPLLTPGAALVTVSSTAAIEAVDRGLPVGIIGDFGVDERHLNALFAGSGMLVTLDEVERLELPHADPAWQRLNYFHTAQDVASHAWPEVSGALDALAEDARAGRLSRDVEVLSRARRRAWKSRARTTLPTPALKAAVAIRNLTR